MAMRSGVGRLARSVATGARRNEGNLFKRYSNIYGKHGGRRLTTDSVGTRIKKSNGSIVTRTAAANTTRTTTSLTTCSLSSTNAFVGLGSIAMGVLDSPAQQLQTRNFGYLKLNNLRDNPGAKRRKKRLGRGVGSGKGKTSGRGHKGQKARSGTKNLAGRAFEGGQTPFIRRIPKWGFTNNNFKLRFNEINLEDLQKCIDRKKIDPTKPINIKDLYNANLFGNVRDGVKLLGRGADKLKQPIQIEVSRASKSAIKAVEDAGGMVVARWYNRLGLRVLTKPSKFHPDLIPKFARPPNTKITKYYTDYDNRGYLSPEMQYKMRGLPVPTNIPRNYAKI